MEARNLKATASPYNKRIEQSARGCRSFRLRDSRTGTPPAAGLPPSACGPYSLQAIKKEIKKKLDELTNNEKLLVLNYRLGRAMKDKIVEEIRALRKKLDKLIEEDPQEFRDEIAAIQKKYRNRLVTLGPRHKKKTTAPDKSGDKRIAGSVGYMR